MRHLFPAYCVLALAFLSCDESLPPRNEPQKFLEAWYSVSTGAVVVVDSTFVDLVGAFVVSVRNTYVEVLQGPEQALVHIDVWMRDMPEQRGTAVATFSDLTDPALVSGGLLTLRPNQTAIFLRQWKHRTTSGKPFWEFVNLTEKFTSRGERYLESDSVHLVAKGTVQLFKTRSQEVLPQIQFTLIYRIF